jgi:hypothetical protein
MPAHTYTEDRLVEQVAAAPGTIGMLRERFD